MDKFFKRNRRFSSFSKWDLIIEGLLVNNKSAFFCALYHAMVEHPSYVILSDMELERKLELLSNMLSYYEEKEDYEKCANLLKIQQQVNQNLC